MNKQNTIPAFLSTMSGTGKYHFLDPSPDEIDIDTIATGLSNVCRYGGKVKVGFFYSVAEHSVVLAKKVLEETGCTEKALSALLHDASEAYLGDVVRGLKQYLPEYTVLEEKAEKVIQEKFNTSSMCEYGKYLDYNVVRDEADILFEKLPEWALPYEEVGVVIHCWEPKKARTEFLKMFTQLRGKGVST